MDEIAQVWSSVAAAWARDWGGFAEPARQRLLDAVGAGPDRRILDVGCGGGELLDAIARTGATATGADPAPAMVALASRGGHDVVEAGFEALPWPDGTFDAVLSINALQFADDPVDGLREAARVTRGSGRVALACWAEAALNDLDVIEAAVARAADDEPGEDPDYRLPGGLERWLSAAGLDVVDAGTVPTPWRAGDDDHLVRAVLLGEDSDTIAERRDVVVSAAAPFRDGDGYLLHNTFRWAVAHVPPSAANPPPSGAKSG